MDLLMARARLVIAVVAAGSMLLAGCAGRAVDTEATVTGSTQASQAPTTSTVSRPVQSATTTTGFVPDYAALVAAIEAEMIGTTYEGAALEDPEVFIATAELFCDLLAEGMTTDDLLAEYIDRLSDGGAVEVDEDDGLMAGVLLGASIEIVCPEASAETP
ncbi:MAG: DUF732 domain-containing protein [Acidimicrobiia bacterium]|nr:DUF732 domain-containing protein [Acidimicrobiia bacterium]